MTRVDDGVEVDGLDLGRPPRPPLHAAPSACSRPASRRSPQPPSSWSSSSAPATTPPAAARTPTVESSAGFAAGPVLVTVDGRDALQAPGLPGLGASVDPVVLDPAPDIVALVRAALPGFRDVAAVGSPVSTAPGVCTSRATTTARAASR